MKKIKLFCIPYGGGSAAVYAKWNKLITYPIELFPVELAGRGRRIATPFYQDIADAVQDIYQSLQGEFDKGPYAIFGHSMGCAMAYELAYKIREFNHHAPVHLFFSGRYPPHVQRKRREFHNLPDSDFILEVLNHGGVPGGFLEQKEARDFFLPILRADFKIIENYVYVPRPAKLNMDITVLGGTDDRYISPEDLAGWRDYTEKEFKLHIFQGGHFFINDYQEEIVSIVNSTLLKYV